MKKTVILTIWALLVPIFCLSAERRHSEASVHGHVLDRNTGEHVPFLVVSLKGTTVGTTTGDTGHYFMEHLQCLPGRLRSGTGPRFRLHLRPCSPSLLLSRRETQLLAFFCFRLLRHQRNHLAYIGPRMPPANAGMMNVYAISQKSMAICFC